MCDPCTFLGGGVSSGPIRQGAGSLEFPDFFACLKQNDA